MEAIPRARLRDKFGRATVMFFAFGVAAYAFAYLFLRERMFPPQLAASFRARPWGIFPHAFFGGVAMVLGPFQFRRSLLLRRRALHRVLGRIYVISSLCVGVAGLYMSPYSYGGVVTHTGFAALAILLLTTTVQAYRAIRRRDVATHREWMLRSYALIFAAVTLRMELPLLVLAFGGSFLPAYRVVAWLCWVPNLLWAEAYIARSHVVASALPQPS